MSALRKLTPTVRIAVLVSIACVGIAAVQQRQRSPEEVRQRALEMSDRANQRVADEPFVGVTVGGEVEAGLFEIKSTGVSTESVRAAAVEFLDALTADQRERSTFPVGHSEWRSWMNQHFYVRRGVSFEEMNEKQRDAAFGLVAAGLSARGLQLSRDIMRLNHTLGELNGDNWLEYGEWLYHLTVMGEPSATEPWGWQLDGHHLIVNYFVLGDQVVMSPAFFGSEPVRAEAGRYAGTAILQDEQAAGLTFANSLNEKQLAVAVLDAAKDGNYNQGEALKDNLVLAYEGLPATELDENQRIALLGLVELFVGNLREPHADIRMEEVLAHLDRTHFAWVGSRDTDAVFYFRIHSPVVLIEFDHQRPANLRHLMPPQPNRQHIHVVVRTPNGNDYGKDLLRQHLESHPHG